MRDYLLHIGTFTDQQVGIIEFEKIGVFNFTIRPTDWYLKTDKVLVSLKNIKLIHE